MSSTIKTDLPIRCALTRQSVWRTLNAPGSKVISKITSLEITPDQPSGLSEALTIPELVPPGTPAGTVTLVTNDKEATAALEADMLSSLAKMTSLRHFTWRRNPGPVLGEELWQTLDKLGVRSLTVIDTKKSYFCEDSNDLDFKSVLETPSFMALTGLTALELTTHRIDGLEPEDDSNHIYALEKLLTANSKTLEVLHLKLGRPDCVVNVSGLVARLKLPRIREISFDRMATTAQGLITFSETNLSIVSLALGPMITGRRWEEIQLSEKILPNIQHLHCTPFQLAMILEHLPPRPLWCLTGIDVRETVVQNEYFGDFPDSWQSPEDVDKEEDAQRGKPLWRDELLPRLKGLPITHLGLNYIDGPQDLNTVAELLPSVRWLDMGKCPDTKIPWTKWAQALSKFKDLRILHGSGCGLHIITRPGPKGEPVKVLEDTVAAALRTIAQACPKLEFYEDWSDSVRIRRSGAQITFDPIKDIEVREEEKDLLFPSQAFVRATIRKEGGPNQPGPNVYDVHGPT